MSIHTMHVCIFSLSLSLSLTHMHTHQNSFMFYSLLLHEVHAVPKQKDPDVILFCFFLSPVRGTNLWQRSGYMVWLRPGSSNICTFLISVYLSWLGVPDGRGLSYRAIKMCSREFRQSQRRKALFCDLKLACSSQNCPNVVKPHWSRMPSMLKMQ